MKIDTLTLASFAVLAISTGSQAAPSTAQRQCVDLQIPIKVDLSATKWLQPRVDSTLDAVEWVLNMTTWTSASSERAIGTVKIDQTFKISGRLCIPPPKTSGPAKSRAKILHLATHGVGFDKRYWDVEVQPASTGEYSYVEAVLAAGYSIFTYDRLGTGRSDKPDAYEVVQTSVQIEILRQITLLARSGKLVASSKKLTRSTRSLDEYRPEKIIQVGHSFGSIAIAGLLSAEGQSSENTTSLADGAILTGFLISDPNKTAQIGMGPGVAGWGFEFARALDPVNFADRPSGYLVEATKANLHLNFFKQKQLPESRTTTKKGIMRSGFDPKLLDYAYKIRQPNTVGEFVSFPGVLGSLRPTAKFKGPVQYMIGENDYAFCRGDCKGTYDVEFLRRAFYPAAEKVEVYLQPGTGHGMTFARNASEGYKASLQFLGRYGL